MDIREPAEMNEVEGGIRTSIGFSLGQGVSLSEIRSCAMIDVFADRDGRGTD